MKEPKLNNRSMELLNAYKPNILRNFNTCTNCGIPNAIYEVLYNSKGEEAAIYTVCIECGKLGKPDWSFWHALQNWNIINCKRLGK